MSTPAATTPESAEASPHGEPRSPPRSDLADGLGWMTLGFAILIGSVTMDRLERQNVNPYTVPGLLPGLLGIAMMLLGGILALRSWRRGALHDPAMPTTPEQREQRRRIWIVIGLCVGYGVVLVGHGLPFWLASTLYVTGSILILQRLSRDPQARRVSLRAAATALAIGLGAAVITHLVFQELFLVRLP
jgi:Tripartite tricarboxylate transporter TctB family